MFTYRIILFVILVIINNLAYADMPFFQDGARPAGMGGAFTAIADDENAIFHNPAGLAYMKKRKFSISTSRQDYMVHMLLWAEELGEDLNYSYYDNRIFVSYIQPTPKFTFGISGGIREKGDDELEVDYPEEAPHFEDTEKMGILSVSKNLNPKLAVGVSLKHVIEESELFEMMIEDMNKSGIDLDIGVIEQLSDKISIGLLLQNVLKSRVNYVIYSYFLSGISPERLPRNVNVGISIRPTRNILIAIDVDNLLEDKVYDEDCKIDYIFKRRYQLGTEFQYKDFFIRAGISQHSQANDFSSGTGEDDKTVIYAIGSGFHNKSLRIDFAATYDKREDEIEKKKTLEVKDPTFRYLVSGSILF